MKMKAYHENYPNETIYTALECYFLCLGLRMAVQGGYLKLANDNECMRVI